MSYLLVQADAQRIPLKDESVHMVCTSPPYFSQRDYGTARWEGGDQSCAHKESSTSRTAASVAASTLGGGKGNVHRSHVFRGACGKCGAERVDRQIGLEETPSGYVAALVGVFREVRRVLRADGSVYLNVGDSFNAYNGNRGASTSFSANTEDACPKLPRGYGLTSKELKQKDVIGIPYRLALALQADGWYWRQTIIWAKTNNMAESVTDRPTSAFEAVFLLTKSPRYAFDWYACARPSKTGADVELPEGWRLLSRLRNVWRISTKPYKGAHFATMPPELAERCVRLGAPEGGCCAGCGAPRKRLVGRNRFPTRPGIDTKVTAKMNGDEKTAAMFGWNRANAIGNRDPRRHVTAYRHEGWEPTCRCGAGETRPCVVFDPFGGSGTTAAVAVALGRRGVITDLSADYLGLARRRIDRPHSRPVKAERSGEAYPLFEGVP